MNMYRSLFTKYMTAFTLIIVVSFTIMAVIVSSTVSTYTSDASKDQLRQTAENVQLFIEKDFAKSDQKLFNNYVYYNFDYIRNILGNFCFFDEDTVVFLTDVNGTILLQSGSDSYSMMDKKVAQSILNAVKSEGEITHTGDLDGFFDSDNIVFIRKICNERVFVGTVFVCVESSNLNQLVGVIVKTIIMTSLWVVLAALIAVYFITERITSPLREMSMAAKSFAAGHFDVRIPVIGHDEVSALATAFNNMADSLTNNEEMRRSFLANVSHDLRTPMTTIAGFIDGILDGAIPPDKHEYYLGIIASEVRRLSRLVTSLLDITRIQAGERKFNMEPFDICEMARLILISFEQKIDEKKLKIEFECDCEKMMVIADRDAIYQILFNLCDNAVKFSYNEGIYRIKINENSGKTFISVYNEGQGIAEDEIAVVFDRFYKSDKSRGLDKTGTGLGLYIAKTIIVAHGEELWVSSVYGKYCEFVFTLPTADKSCNRE